MRTQAYESPTQEEGAALLLLAFGEHFGCVERADNGRYSAEAYLDVLRKHFRVWRRGLKDGWGPQEAFSLLGQTFGQQVAWLERHGLVELREEPPDPEHGGPRVIEGRRTDKGESLIARVIAA